MKLRGNGGTQEELKEKRGDGKDIITVFKYKILKNNNKINIFKGYLLLVQRSVPPRDPETGSSQEDKCHLFHGVGVLLKDSSLGRGIQVHAPLFLLVALCHVLDRTASQCLAVLHGLGFSLHNRASALQSQLRLCLLEDLGQDSDFTFSVCKMCRNGSLGHEGNG